MTFTEQSFTECVRNWNTCLLNYFFPFQESWACLKIKEENKVFRRAQPGRKLKNVTKDMNLQAVAREFGDIDREDYLRRVGNILFKEF
jgi:hypothetical protein